MIFAAGQRIRADFDDQPLAHPVLMGCGAHFISGYNLVSFTAVPGPGCCVLGSCSRCRVRGSSSRARTRTQTENREREPSTRTTVQGD